MRHTSSSGFLDEGSVGSLTQSYLVKNTRGGATASKGVTGKNKVCLDTVDRCTPTSTAEFVPNVPNADDVLVVHTDVDHAKLEKGDASTDATTASNVNDGGTENAIVDDMVVDACIDAIADATIVDACTNDIVDAMEVDASIDVAADGNVNDGGTESIVRVVIDALLNAVEAMGTDATVEDTKGMGEEVLIEREAGTCEAVGASDVTVQAKVVCPMGASDVTAQAKVVCQSDATVEDIKGRGEEVLIKREAGTREAVDASDVTVQAEVVCPSDAADDIVDAEEAKGTDAAVEDMRGLSEEDLTKTAPRIGSAVGTNDVATFVDTAEAGDRAVQLGEAMGEAIVAATDMKETNTHISIEACIEQNNAAKKGTEVLIDKATQLGEAMGEDTNEASTKNANKVAKKGHETEGQERVKCLVKMPV
ncbi:hypothetical protein L7F22_039890 [Adiantum nelumboides]|nr:hypothetical protein [Adiantum nelumboides]